jgi:hypothetical protein
VFDKHNSGGIFGGIVGGIEHSTLRRTPLCRCGGSAKTLRRARSPPMICGTCLKNPGTTHYAAITSLIAANAKNANSCKQSTYIIGGITQYLGIITQILGESARLRLTVF